MRRSRHRSRSPAVRVRVARTSGTRGGYRAVVWAGPVSTRELAGCRTVLPRLLAGLAALGLPRAGLRDRGGGCAAAQRVVVVLRGKVIRQLECGGDHAVRGEGGASGVREVVVDGQVGRDGPRLLNLRRPDGAAVCVGEALGEGAGEMLVEQVPDLVQQRLGAPQVATVGHGVEVDVHAPVPVDGERAQAGRVVRVQRVDQRRHVGHAQQRDAFPHGQQVLLPACQLPGKAVADGDGHASADVGPTGVSMCESAPLECGVSLRSCCEQPPHRGIPSLGTAKVPTAYSAVVIPASRDVRVCITRHSTRTKTSGMVIPLRC